MTTQPAAPSASASDAAPGERFALHECMMGEARSIIDSARAAGVVLRLIGGLAVRHHCTDLAFADREYGDIDMAGRRSQSRRIGETFARLGFRENVHVAQATQLAQRQYLRGAGTDSVADHIDVFLDEMAMDHVIDLRDRLRLDDYAIAPADALLTKLQIFRLTQKDVHDIIALVKDVPLSRGGSGHVIDIRYIADLCAADWGLYADVEANIEKCLAALGSFDLPDADYDRVKSSLAALEVAMSTAAKTLRWKLRARIGRRMAWNREVEEQDRSVTAPSHWEMPG
jgi:hypothetical protein